MRPLILFQADPRVRAKRTESRCHRRGRRKRRSRRKSAAGGAESRDRARCKTFIRIGRLDLRRRRNFLRRDCRNGGMRLQRLYARSQPWARSSTYFRSKARLARCEDSAAPVRPVNFGHRTQSRSRRLRRTKRPGETRGGSSRSLAVPLSPTATPISTLPEEDFLFRTRFAT